MNIGDELSQIVVGAVILFLLFFIVSGLIPSTTYSEETNPNTFTHQVFAEYATTTW